MINKILYYFGYAPIKISHEVVFHHVGKPIETVIFRRYLEFDDFDDRMHFKENKIEELRKRKLDAMLFEEIEKSGMINYLRIKDSIIPNQKIYAELEIVKQIK